MDNPVEGTREPKINRSFAKLEQAIDRLDKILSEYGQRLEPILSPIPPISPGGTPEIAEALTPMVKRLDRATDRVCEMIEYVTGLSSRTEV